MTFTPDRKTLGLAYVIIGFLPSFLFLERKKKTLHDLLAYIFVAGLMS
jgi:uncharacterized RDD family membrane protein YckC